jgi:hypothetical protein
MKQNVGNFDRVARVLIAVAVALLYFTDQITGTLALILGLVAVILVATSLMSFCPIYKMLGLTTRKIEKTA